MLVCTSCGKTHQRGKYCSLCGSVLKERILNYETTNTLLRSNVRLDSVRPVSQDDASNVYGTLPRVKKEQASYMNKTAASEMYNPELSESFRHSFDEALKKKETAPQEDAGHKKEEERPADIAAGKEEKELNEPKSENIPQLIEETPEPVDVEEAPVEETPEPVEIEEVPVEEIPEPVEVEEVPVEEIPELVEVEEVPESVEEEAPIETKEEKSQPEIEQKPVYNSSVADADIDPMFGPPPTMQYTMLKPGEALIPDAVPDKAELKRLKKLEKLRKKEEKRKLKNK